MNKLFPAFVFVTLLSAGCGDRTVHLPSAAPASGKVTLANGQPVKDVRIFFQPIESMAGASASVKADGTFTLQTYDNHAGACPGKYRVIFQQLQGSTTEMARSRTALRAIPPKYQQDDSPLVVEVPSGGKTDFDLKLDAR